MKQFYYKAMLVQLRKLVLYTLVSFFTLSINAHEIVIIGCGHLGLTMATFFAQEKHSVLCVDINDQKITQLKHKSLHIYEPRIADILFDPAKDIQFFDTIAYVAHANIFYICVDTPVDSEGNCDCLAVHHAVQEILNACTDHTAHKIICVKSTVKPGTMRKLQDYLNQIKRSDIQLVYNPEFMREGSALTDMYENNPIVLAAQNSESIETIATIYARITIPIIKTDFETAELIKYAWNSFSAMRIAYINELATICQSINANISTVVQTIAFSEKLLPTECIKPGPGYGGSCLPKETASFAKMFREYGFSSSIIEHVIISNQLHQERIITNISKQLDKLTGIKVVTLLGLTFKANTNDFRNAPSIKIIPELLKRKDVTIKAYDPQAMDAVQKLFPEIAVYTDPYQAVTGTNCIVALTDWPEIQKLDLAKIAPLCATKIIFDTRNIFNPQDAQKYNFTYMGIGNKNS